MTTVLWYSDGNHNFTASNAWNQAADGSGTAGNPDTDDRVLIQSGDTVTLDNNVTIGTCGISGTLTGNTSYSLTLAGSSEDFNYSNSGTVTNLNIIMTGLRASGDRSMIDIGSGIRDLTLNDATNSGNNVHHIASNLSISGDLTITEGTLNTGHGGTDRTLTVAGTTTLTGTLNLNGSTASFNSGATAGGVILGTAGYINGDADSTVTMGSISATGTGNRGVSLAGTNTINKYKASDDLIINLMDGTVDGTTLFTVTTPDAKGFALQDYTASLTLNPGSSTAYKLEDTMTVDKLTINSNASLTTLDGSSNRGLNASGDCIVNGTLTGNASAINMGSLTINSGGTYSATSGTTTITNRNSNAKYWENGGGTFTHNNGTVKFTDNDHSGVVENTFYNMHIASANANHYAVSWEDVSGNALKVLNNLIIESGDFELATAGDTLDVYGKTIIDNSLAGGTPNNAYARFNNDKNQTGTITHHGIVEIISGTYHVEDGATVNMAGIRNVGGLVD